MNENVKVLKIKHPIKLGLLSNYKQIDCILKLKSPFELLLIKEKGEAC